MLFVAVPRGKDEFERAIKLNSMLTGAVSSSSSLSTDKHSRLAEPVRTRSSASTSQREYLRTKRDMFNFSSMPSVAASCVRSVCNPKTNGSAPTCEELHAGTALKNQSSSAVHWRGSRKLFHLRWQIRATCNSTQTAASSKSMESRLCKTAKDKVRIFSRQNNNPCVSIFSPRMLCADYQAPFIGQYLHAFCTHR